MWRLDRLKMSEWYSDGVGVVLVHTKEGGAGREEWQTWLLERGSVVMHGSERRGQLVGRNVLRSGHLTRVAVRGPVEQRLLSTTPPWSGVCPGHRGTHRTPGFHLTDCW